MKKYWLALASFFLFLNLSGCIEMPQDQENITDVRNPSATAEQPGTSQETVTETGTSTFITETAEPEHSDLHMPDYTLQQVREYFQEVVLKTEYSDGTGDNTLIQKWIIPLRYRIYGTTTEEDMAVLDDLFARLNAVPGFPGIYEAEAGVEETISIYFLDQDSFNEKFQDFFGGEDAYGGTRYWYYTDTNEIYTAYIGYRTDIDQQTRSSILVEEIINVLGITDTVLREDSIVYQYSNENMTLSDIDWLIVKLLYDPAIQPGMDADRCAEVLQELYY